MSKLKSTEMPKRFKFLLAGDADIKKCLLFTPNYNDIRRLSALILKCSASNTYNCLKNETRTKKNLNFSTIS